ILGGEDVARGPAHTRPERLQRLDEHRGLDGHVKRPGDARALQGLSARELLAYRHETGHLGLRDRDLLAPEVGECQVGDLVVAAVDGGFQCGVHDDTPNDRVSAVWMTRRLLSLAGTVPVRAPVCRNAPQQAWLPRCG